MISFLAQEKLSDSFRQASAKIGATIGLRMAEQEQEEASNPESHGEDGEEMDGAAAGHYGRHLSPNDAREVSPGQARPRPNKGSPEVISFTSREVRSTSLSSYYDCSVQCCSVWMEVKSSSNGLWKLKYAEVESRE